MSEAGLLQLHRLGHFEGSAWTTVSVRVYATGYLHCSRVYAAVALERVCCSRDSVSGKISSVLWGRLGQGVKEDCTEARYSI